MKITCLTTFLDGRDRFEKDDVRTVDDERGAYFVANGWAVDQSTVVEVAAAEAKDPAPPGGHQMPAPLGATLNVQDSILGQEANHG